jgi:hypothetical protein
MKRPNNFLNSEELASESPNKKSKHELILEE